MPKRLECEVLQKVRYISALIFPLPSAITVCKGHDRYVKVSQ